MVQSIQYDAAPHFIFVVNHEIKILIDNNVVFPGIESGYRLCGIIYFANYHFVCRIIDKNGGVWYHDGNDNNSQVLYYGNIINFSAKKLQNAGNYEMRLAIYTNLQ